MKKGKILFYVSVLAILSCVSAVSYGQEEFFDDQSGITLQYLKNVSINASSFGFGIYSKRGFIIGLASEELDHRKFPLIAFSLCPNWRDKFNHYKMALGASYAKIEDNHLLGFNLSLFRTCLTKSNFPFSVSVSFSPQMVINPTSTPSYNSTTPYKSIGQDEYKNRTTEFDFGYTQTFFAGHPVFPFISILDSYVLETKSHFVSVMGGFGVKM